MPGAPRSVCAQRRPATPAPTITTLCPSAAAAAEVGAAAAAAGRAALGEGRAARVLRGPSASLPLELLVELAELLEVLETELLSE